MNCRQAGPMLIAYLDGRASVSERKNVETHLASCTACRARADEFRRLWGVLDELPGVEPSPMFDARVRQAVAAEPRRSWLGWLVPAPRLAVSVAMLVAMSAWMASLPPAAAPQLSPMAKSEEEFKAIQNLQVLENYDVLANFDALSQLPQTSPAQAQPQSQDQ